MIETSVVGATDVGEGAVNLTGAVRRARPTPNGAPWPTPRTAPPLSGPAGAGLRSKEPTYAAVAVGVGLGIPGIRIVLDQLAVEVAGKKFWRKSWPYLHCYLLGCQHPYHF